MKKLSALFLLAATLTTISGCEWNNQNETPQVIATLFPQYEFASALAGEWVDVKMVLPFGASAHTFDPSPSVVGEMLNADLILYTSPILEIWMDDLILSQSNSDVVSVDLSVGITLLEGHHHEEEEAIEEDHDEEEFDPHYWLDPMNALIMVQTITDALIELVPDHEADILANQLELVAEINQWHEANLELVEHATVTTIIHGGHNAFGYFTNRYGIEYLTPYEGFSTDSQPTPSAIIELTAALESLGVDVIYSEEIVSSVVADSIASQTGARVLQLSTGGSLTEAAFNAGTSFFDIMYANIDKLKDGLKYDNSVTN